ncbi:hypothetical protein [Vibrio parahaemolyticus]|uniref:hypothetical protein n=1 Tax=Vibrio parahaemolyticus TaxID=670 RepID=UPI0032AE8501
MVAEYIPTISWFASMEKLKLSSVPSSDFFYSIAAFLWLGTMFANWCRKERAHGATCWFWFTFNRD